MLGAPVIRTGSFLIARRHEARALQTSLYAVTKKRALHRRIRASRQAAGEGCMNNRSYKLAPENHGVIFETMREDMLAGSEAAEKPVLAIIGGQPGSLRAKLRAAAVEGVAPAPVIVSEAEARHFHPHAAELLARDEKSFMQATEADAEKWAEGLVLAAIEGRRNIVLDGFFKRQEATLEVLRQARDAGYDAQVQAVAVPERISRARIVDIYEAGKERLGWGTWVSARSHDEDVQTLMKTLTAIANRGIAHIRLFDRKGVLLHATGETEARDAGAAFRREIAMPLDASDKERLKMIERRIEAKMEARQAGVLERREAQTVIRSGLHWT
jgi:hypothetical protein